MACALRAASPLAPSVRLSHKSKALERTPTKGADGTPTPRPQAESTGTALAVVGQIDNERPSPRTYATAKPLCSSGEYSRHCASQAKRAPALRLCPFWP
jgi:hypothetical protein